MLDVKFKKEYADEADVKVDIKKLLDADGWFWWMPPANGYGGRTVDFNAIKSGVFLAIEAKKYPKKPTALQIGFLNSVRAEDGFGFVVDEKRLDHLKAFLEAFGRATIAASKGTKVDDADGAMLLNMISEMTIEL